MRVLVDVDEGELRALERIAKTADRSRAAVIREAIAAYVAAHRPAPAAAAFGLWGAAGEDGLAYQDRLRDEW
jgi:predicted transcriptional regulator